MFVNFSRITFSNNIIKKIHDFFSLIYFKVLQQILDNRDDKKTLENKNQAILNSLSGKLAKIPKEEINEIKLTNFYQYIKEEIVK